MSKETDKVVAAAMQSSTVESEGVETKYGGKNPSPIVLPNGGKQFGPGNRMNVAGKKKGRVNGRTQIIRLIDALCEQPEIQKALAEAIVETIDTGNRQALDILKTIIMPMTPKEVLVKGEGDKQEATKLGVKIVVQQQAATQESAQ